MKKFLLHTLRYILFATVGWFLFKSISQNFDKIRSIDFSQYDPMYMFAFVITLFVSLIYPVFVWKFLLGTIGEKINTLSALRTWFISNLGRYIPGKVFQLAGLVYFSGKEGVSRTGSIQSVLYSQITANGLGLFMGLGLILARSSNSEFPNDFHIALILICLFITVLWFPSIFVRSSNFVLKRFKRSLIEEQMGRRDYMVYLVLQIFNWLLMSLGFIFLIKAYTDISVIEDPELLFILPLSWTIGLLALFAPGGIGVREGAMSYWLNNFIPIQYALVLPWIYRIMNTFVYSTKSDSTNLYNDELDGGKNQECKIIDKIISQRSKEHISPIFGEENVEIDYDLKNIKRTDFPITLDPKTATFHDVAIHSLLRQRLSKNTVQKRMSTARFMETH
ncbi:MAG: lysylphosphatidylglycerol synthase transmembrane domain-containing protein, partial [Candidatus Delongbacteria bacterium]